MRKCRCICCKIVREAVLNAIKHANASEIAVSVTAPDGDHTVYIRDNGTGIGEPVSAGQLWSEYNAWRRAPLAAR